MDDLHNTYFSSREVKNDLSIFLILFKLSKLNHFSDWPESSSLHPTALVLCTHSYIYIHPDSLVCECTLPKQSCLWALAWPNQLSLTPLDMISFVFEIHRVVHNPSPPPPPPLKPKPRRLKGGKSLLFTPLNVRSVRRFTQDVFLLSFFSDEQVWWIILPSPSQSWPNTPSSSRPTTISSSPRNMRWVSQKVRGLKVLLGIDFCLTVFSLQRDIRASASLPQGKWVLLTFQAFFFTAVSQGVLLGFSLINY